MESDEEGSNPVPYAHLVSSVLLVEPYYSGSHRAWADGLVQHCADDVQLVTHPGQFWRWRMRGASLTLGESIVEHVRRHGLPDMLLVSGMVDLAALLGFCRHAIGDIPVVLYLHENQLLYPLESNAQPDQSLSLRNWTSLAVADRVVFNSEFHRGALFDALPWLLRQAPDQSHQHRLDAVRDASSVLPVGVEVMPLLDGARGGDGGSPIVLWNQRWDHDKNPRIVLDALASLAGAGLDFRVALAGENQRVDPQEFHRAQASLGERVLHVGFLDTEAYHSLLLRSDVVPSAARHEFFGIAIVEAIAAGATPVLPDRLIFPELVGDRYRDAVLYDDLEVGLASVIEDRRNGQVKDPELRSSMARFDWSVVAPRYDEYFDEFR